VVYQDKVGHMLKMTRKRGETLKKCLSNLPKDYKFVFKTSEKTYMIPKSEITVSNQNKESKVEFSQVYSLSSTIVSTLQQIISHNQSEFQSYNTNLCKTYHESFQSIVDYLGELDLYSTQAYLSINYGYCCPKVDDTTDESYLDAKEIRHPLVERVQQEEPYVPNDVILRENGMLLFGTNACGKSTLMKSIGISIVLAQAGFYVPCREFTYSPYTQLFTRILNNDNLFQKQSSFAVEMNELRSILNRANRKSLVLGDELCSGTENVSAISIVSAGLHTLSQKRCSYVFTSHLHQLTEIPLVKNNTRLKICHLKIEYDIQNDLLIYDRKLSEGSGPPVYGLEVCKAMHLDSEFLAIARKVQLSLMGESQTQLNLKQSNYNANVMMDKCEVCKTRPAVETHHIKEQQTSDVHKMQGHHHQNVAHNLVPLCKECHAKVTYNQYCIEGYKQTSQGLQLMHHKNPSGSESKDKSSRKKYSPQQVQVVETYKDKLENGWTQKKCILDLKHTHEIHISDTTFRKIITGNY
jgi:DNA mismatch repair protein MutS